MGDEEVGSVFSDVPPLEFEMLDNVRAALIEHERICCANPRAILMHPGNHSLIGWDEVLGLPVLSDPVVLPKMAKVICGIGRAGEMQGRPVIWDSDGVPWVTASP